jgi:hypothetical protein
MRGSQILTVPSRPPVASSGAPFPMDRPPIPSMQFTMLVCARTDQTGLVAEPVSRLRMATFPPMSPTARCRSSRKEAPKVEHLMPTGYSISRTTLTSFGPISWTTTAPVPRGCEPRTTKRDETGIHRTSVGVKFSDLVRCSMIWGASVVCITPAPAGPEEEEGEGEGDDDGAARAAAARAASEGGEGPPSEEEEDEDMV